MSYREENNQFQELTKQALQAHAAKQAVLAAEAAACDAAWEIARDAAVAAFRDFNEAIEPASLVLTTDAGGPATLERARVNYLRLLVSGPGTWFVLVHVRWIHERGWYFYYDPRHALLNQQPLAALSDVLAEATRMEDFGAQIAQCMIEPTTPPQPVIAVKSPTKNHWRVAAVAFMAVAVALYCLRLYLVMAASEGASAALVIEREDARR